MKNKAKNFLQILRRIPKTPMKWKNAQWLHCNCMCVYASRYFCNCVCVCVCLVFHIKAALTSRVLCGMDSNCISMH